MSYRGLGQIPTNGGYVSGGSRNGIFGQVPTNGGYRTQQARSGIFAGVGQFPTGAVYLEPPYYNDGGLLRIDQQTLPTFKWSVNGTTTTDPSQGSTMIQVPGFAHTYIMEIASVPFGATGDHWLDSYLGEGYVVMYAGKPVEQIGTTLSFAISKDPKYIAANTAEQANFMMIIDGPEALISQAKALVAGLPPGPGQPGQPGQVGGCPPGQWGVPPFCFGTPTQPPGTPPPPGAAQCKPGEQEFLGICLYQPPCKPGDREMGGLCYPDLPGPPGTQPPGTQPPGTQPSPGTQPPGTQPPSTKPPTHVAKAAAPDWLFPVLVGVAGISVFALVRAGKKKRRA